jgi:hypothetical protein
MLPQTNDNNAYISILPDCTLAPFFVNEISYPLTLMIILHYCVMNVKDAYMFIVTNINFVLININSMPIYGSLYVPVSVQVAYYCKFSST